MGKAYFHGKMNEKEQDKILECWDYLYVFACVLLPMPPEWNAFHKPRKKREKEKILNFIFLRNKNEFQFL